MKQELAGTFAIHLQQCLVNTKLQLIEKLTRLEQWMKYGPYREMTRKKAVRVSMTCELIRNSLAKTAQDIDLDLVSEIGKQEKLKQDLIRNEVLKFVRKKMEVKHEELQAKTAFDFLRKKLLAEGINDNILSKSEKERQLALSKRQSLRTNQLEPQRSPMMESIRESTSKRLSALLEREASQSKIPDAVFDPKFAPIKNNGLTLTGNAIGIANTAAEAHDPKIVVYPRYEEKDGVKDYYKEIDPPSKTYYVELGYDSKTHGELKHYRKFVHCPLEDTDFMSERSFNAIPIHTGKTVATQNRNWLQRWLFKDETYKEVGHFNGSFMLIEDELLMAIENMDIRSEYLYMFGLPATVEDWSYGKQDKSILVPHKVIVRLYVIDAEISTDTDLFSDPDPYLRISLGNENIDVRIVNTRMPKLT
jgi:hypothetical protein